MLHTMPAAQTIATTPVRNLCMTAPLLPRCVQVVLPHQPEIIGRPQFIEQSIAVLQRRCKDSLNGQKLPRQASIGFVGWNDTAGGFVCTMYANRNNNQSRAYLYRPQEGPST